MNSILESAHQTFPNRFYAAGSIILFVTIAIMFMILLIKLLDVDDDIHAWTDNFCVVVGVVLAICVIVGMLLVLKGMVDAEVTANNKHNLHEWHRFEKAVSADSGYTFYYNGQAVSGASIIINKDNLDDYLIEYDKTNKVVKIMSRK